MIDPSAPVVVADRARLLIEVVHSCPPPGSDVMSCCGRTPFEVPRYHRMTLDPDLVTCPLHPIVTHSEALKPGTRITLAEPCETCRGGGEVPVIEYGTSAITGMDQCMHCRAGEVPVGSATVAESLPLEDTDQRSGKYPVVLICPSGIFRSDRNSSQPDYNITDVIVGEVAPGRFALTLEHTETEGQ